MHQRLTDEIRRGVDDGTAEVPLGKDQRIARGRLLRHCPIPLEVLAPDKVIGEMHEVDSDARLHERVLHQRQDRGELGPRDVERLEVLETSRPQEATLERLSSSGQLRQEAFGVGARERREGLPSDVLHNYVLRHRYELRSAQRVLSCSAGIASRRRSHARARASLDTRRRAPRRPRPSRRARRRARDSPCL